jgi:hypothetical protein
MDDIVKESNSIRNAAIAEVSEEQAAEIRTMYREGLSLCAIASLLGLDVVRVGRVTRGEAWHT